MIDIWYMDKDGSHTSNLSDAVRVFFVGDEVHGDGDPQDFTNLPDTIKGEIYEAESLDAVGFKE